MSWPLASHFSAALQNPRVAFRDPQLQQCTLLPRRPGSREPKPWSGNFAVVYKGFKPGGSEPFAIRVFTSESPERRERYETVAAHLESRRPRCIVDFQYRDNSIRAMDGKWYPVITMDWVEGETLFQWAKIRCQAGDREALLLASDHLWHLVGQLESAGVAHGDLQHGNIMVTGSGEMKLVDYDCMCVPALVGRRNLETGMEPYQHPDRNEFTALTLERDRFSALVIYTALLALAADPGLWQRHVAASDYDKLLFRSEDFRNPGGSRLMAELGRLPDVEVGAMAGLVAELYRGPMGVVPRPETVAYSFFQRKVERLLRSGEYTAAFDLLKRRALFEPPLRSRVDAQDWAGVFAWIRQRIELPGAPHPALVVRTPPAELAALVGRAQAGVEREEAWNRVRAVYEALPLPFSQTNDSALVGHWNDRLFARYRPARKYVPYVEAARQRLDAVEEICRLAQDSDAQGLSIECERAIVAAARAFPVDYRHRLEVRTAEAQRRVEAIERLESAIEGGGEKEIVEAGEVFSRFDIETLVPAEWHQRIDLALRRLPLVQRLGKLSFGLPPDQLDEKLLAVWGGAEELLADCRNADAWRARYEEALRRRQLRDELERAIRDEDDEAMVRAANDPLMIGTPLSNSAVRRIEAAKERVGTVRSILAVLEENDAVRDDQEKRRLRGRFFELFDAAVIRRNADLFQGYESVLRQWTRADVLPRQRLGLQPATARASLYCVDKKNGKYRACWMWPTQRFVERCLLAVCREDPGPAGDPREVPIRYQLPVDRQSYIDGGGKRVFYTEPDWTGSCVVVWAVVDLGLEIFYSEPLVLGCLGEEQKPTNGRRRRLFGKGRTAAGDEGSPGVAPPAMTPGSQGVEEPGGTGE